MKKIFSILIVSVSLISCEENVDSAVPCNESVEATLRDLTGQDGCWYVFELNDGTRLEPYRLGYCGLGPLPKEVTEDPLYQFEWVDGKRVRIGYKNMDDAFSSCMAGQLVKISCIETLDQETTAQN
jgi:hypothetical protein